MKALLVTLVCAVIAGSRPVPSTVGQAENSQQVLTAKRIVLTDDAGVVRCEIGPYPYVPGAFAMILKNPAGTGDMMSIISEPGGSSIVIRGGEGTAQENGNAGMIRLDAAPEGSLAALVGGGHQTILLDSIRGGLGRIQLTKADGTSYQVPPLDTSSGK